MILTQDWRDTLAKPAERAHTVQLYSDVAFLVDAVGHYAGAGLSSGDAVVLVATAGHYAAFTQRLAADGFDVRQLTARGQLTFLDAAETLARIMANGRPQADRFVSVIGGVLDQVQAGGRFGRVRAYGEMVNLLWEQGDLSAALLLEELWNDLGSKRAFSLHCAYALDNFDPATYRGTLECVHRAHTSLIPVQDYRRLEMAVDYALADVLGSGEAQLLKSTLTTRPPLASSMPAAQAVILGLSEMLPQAVEAVLARARCYYEGRSTSAA